MFNILALFSVWLFLYLRERDPRRIKKGLFWNRSAKAEEVVGWKGNRVRRFLASQQRRGGRGGEAVCFDWRFVFSNWLSREGGGKKLPLFWKKVPPPLSCLDWEALKEFSPPSLVWKGRRRRRLENRQGNDNECRCQLSEREVAFDGIFPNIFRKLDLWLV